MLRFFKHLLQPAKQHHFAGCCFFRFAFFSLLLSFTIGTLNAQTSYYIVYENGISSPNTKIFRSLITLQPGGTAVARIQYNNGPNNTLFLYEQALIDSSIEVNGVITKYLLPSGAPVPLIESDSAGFAVPRFVFTKQYDSAGYYYEPSGVELNSNNDNWITGLVTQNEQKNYEDLRLNEPFVSAFYFESDAFYQYIFNETTSKDVPIARKEKMYLIVVANTLDATVGKSAETDLENVSTLFNNLASNLGISTVIPLYISGNRYSKAAVEAGLLALESQKPAPIDIVVFYFSGHGFRLEGDNSRYPRMSFRTARNKANKEIGDNMPLEDVYKRINALKPGVSLVMGDCCNADIYENPVLGTDVIRSRGGGSLGSFNIEAARKLFLPPAPLSIIVGSVKKNHLSLGHPDIGGYYTHFFLSELEKNIWGFYSNTFLSFGGQSNAAWLKILLEARKNTYWKAKAIQCGKTSNDRCLQEAEIDVKFVSQNQF